MAPGFPGAVRGFPDPVARVFRITHSPLIVAGEPVAKSICTYGRPLANQDYHATNHHQNHRKPAYQLPAMQVN